MRQTLRITALTFLFAGTLITAHATGITPGWSIQFNSEKVFNQFKVLDNNNDESTWIYYVDGSGKGSACYVYNTQNDADDWLVTPAIALKAGIHYKLRFHARANSNYYKENLEVKAATDASVARLSSGTSLLPNTELGNDTTFFERSFTPDHDGDYYFGFHAISKANANRLFLYDISISEGASDVAPSMVRNVRIVPDATGKLTASVQFTTPATTVGGATLTSVDSVLIERNGVLISTLRNLPPASRRSYSDLQGAINGNNTYTLTAYKDGAKSDPATATAFIGVVAPQRPSQAAIEADGTAILMKWSKVAEGETEGRFNPDLLSYEVFGFDATNKPTIKMATVENDTTCTLAVNTSEGAQHLAQYAVRAVNTGGASSFTYSNALISGAPYTLPFRESFTANGKQSFEHFWWMDGEGNGYFYGISNIAFDKNSSDGDASSLKYSIYGYNDKLNLKTGKVKLTNSKNLKMAFDYRTDGADKCVMNVDALMPDGSLLNLKKFDLNNASTWQKAIVSLPSYLGLLDYVMLQIQLECTGSPDNIQTLYVDNVNIADTPDHDAAVKLSLPEKAQKGKTTQLTVRVTNLGSMEARNYKVSITQQADTLFSQQVSEPLAAFGYRDFSVSFTPNVLATDDSLALKASVELNGDENISNNVADGKLAVYDYTGLTITDLTATSGKNNVTLHWSAPATHNEQVTESFETYTPWITTGIGDWVTLAKDSALAGSLFDDFQMPHEHEHYAFMVTNFEPDYHAGSYYPGHTGFSYLSSVYGVSDDFKEHKATDRWLISPALSGNAQTIKFYALKHDGSKKAYNEHVRVLYSTTDNAPESFKPAGDEQLISSPNWQEVTASIPAGATFFAIRSKNAPGDCNWLALDDISYEKGTGHVKNYRVYRDGKLVGEVKEGTAFTDEGLSEGTYTYQVTVVYMNGNETAPVTVKATVDATTGIISISSSHDTFDVFDLSGRLVRKNTTGLNGLPKGVYIVNGIKITVK